MYAGSSFATPMPSTERTCHVCFVSPCGLFVNSLGAMKQGRPPRFTAKIVLSVGMNSFGSVKLTSFRPSEFLVIVRLMVLMIQKIGGMSTLFWEVFPIRELVPEDYHFLDEVHVMAVVGILFDFHPKDFLLAPKHISFLV